MKFPELFHLWLQEARIATWESFSSELEKKLLRQEQNLAQIARQHAWSVNTAASLVVTLPTGLQIKPLGKRQFEKRAPDGTWLKGDPKSDLSGDEHAVLATLVAAFADVSRLRQALAELPSALAGFQEHYREHLQALRSAKTVRELKDTLLSARDFYLQRKALLPVAARREFLGTRQQLLQTGFNQARSTQEAAEYRENLREFFRCHCDEAEKPAEDEDRTDGEHQAYHREHEKLRAALTQWEEEFILSEEFQKLLAALRSARTESAMDQARTALDTVIRERGHLLPPGAPGQVAAAFDLACQNFPPGLPARVQATRVHHDGIRISWEKARGATEYRVFRADSASPESRSFLGESRPPHDPAPGFLDAEVELDQEYFYWITALNAHGESDFAGPAAGRTKKRSTTPPPDDPPPPTVPPPPILPDIPPHDPEPPKPPGKAEPQVEEPETKPPQKTVQPGEFWIPAPLTGFAHAGQKLRLTQVGGPPAADLHFVARAEFRIGRATKLVDLVTRFWPRNPGADELTKQLGRVHVLGGLVENQPAFQDAASLNGTTLDDEPLTGDILKPLVQRGTLKLGANYLLDVIPLPAASDQPLAIANLAEWRGTPTGPPPGRGAVRFQPLNTGSAGPLAVWLFSDAGFGSREDNAVTLESPEIAGSQGRVYYHCDHFWITTLVANRAVQVNDLVLEPGEIAPLAGGQQVKIGPFEFAVAIGD